jgi:hypothetical protein
VLKKLQEPRPDAAGAVAPEAGNPGNPDVAAPIGTGGSASPQHGASSSVVYTSPARAADQNQPSTTLRSGSEPSQDDRTRWAAAAGAGLVLLAVALSIALVRRSSPKRHSA